MMRCTTHIALSGGASPRPGLAAPDYRSTVHHLPAGASYGEVTLAGVHAATSGGQLVLALTGHQHARAES